MAIIVGDLHGNVEKVRSFLAYKPEKEHIALGDYLDSFFESPRRQIEAMQLLLDSDAVLLWGNHDLHYLLKPPFICTGFQYFDPGPFQQIIEDNKNRFRAAYVVDEWLCTHAGVHEGLVSIKDISELASKFNRKMSDFLKNPRGMGEGMFGIGKGRGGVTRRGGIFWFDFQREFGLAADIKQVFGHTETREPVVTSTFIALDTTNCADTCYLFDTETVEIVKLKMPLLRTSSDINFGDKD